GFQTRFEQQLLEKRIADLNRGALRAGLLAELFRGHRCAVYSVTAGLRADVDHRVPDTRRSAKQDVFLAHQPERERVHQRIARITVREANLAADGRNSKRVAVV